MHELERLDAPGRRCRGTNRSGGPCGLAPIAGGYVCWAHGGKAPQTVAAAKQRLLAMVEPVLAAFHEIIENWHGTRCETCGRPTGDPMPVIRVGQLILDRAGFHPSLSVEIEHSAPLTTFSDMSTLELADFAEAQARELRAMADQEATRLLPEAMDAVLLDAFLVPEDDAETGTDASTPEDGQTVLADSTQPIEAVEVLPADAVSGKPWRLGTDGSDTPEDGYGSFPERNKPK